MSTEYRHHLRTGPLPDPEDLARYEAIVPGLADRLAAMAQDQQRHRFGLEEKVVTSQLRRSWVGLLAGWSVTMAGLLIAGYVAVTANPLAGAGIASTTLFTLAGVFFYEGRREHDRASTPANVQPPTRPDSVAGLVTNNGG